jgi:DNA-binding Lrp family transcriptional regulator
MVQTLDNAEKINIKAPFRRSEHNMDEIDVKLCKLLFQNPRVPYRELADELDLSINAIHRRIHELSEAGILRRFRAGLGCCSMSDAVEVMMFGKTSSESIDKTVKKLGKNDSIHRVLLAGGNFMYIWVTLRNISYLAKVGDYVKKEGAIPDLTIAIPDMPMGPHDEGMKMTRLDYQIIYQLHANAKMELTEVGEKIGVSVKTVRRRLTRMIDKKGIDFGTDLDFSLSDDIVTLTHIRIKDNVDAKKFIANLHNNHPIHVLWAYRFSNMPNQILCYMWSKSMREVRFLQQQIQADESVVSMMPNLVYAINWFESWADDLLRKLAESK